MAANAVAKIPFSGSVQGKPVTVVATATVGTTIHTTGTSATVIDELWIYAYNSYGSDQVLSIEFGGVTLPITVTVPSKAGLMLVIPGFPLLGNGSVALVVTAFAPQASTITLSGFVNRITP